MENDFLKNLDASQVREIVESMYPREFEKGSFVIREGDAGKITLEILSIIEFFVQLNFRCACLSAPYIFIYLLFVSTDRIAFVRVGRRGAGSHSG